MGYIIGMYSLLTAGNAKSIASGPISISDTKKCGNKVKS